MKVNELLAEAASYDNKKKQLKGTTKEWMAAIGATKEDIATARAQALELPSYKRLVKLLGQDISTEAMKKNGTFVFKRGDDGEKYQVYANGQIRASSDATNAGWTNGPIEKTGEQNQTKLVSPKPRLKHGDPVKSIVMIYDGAFKELAKKQDKKKVSEAYTPDSWNIWFESKFGIAGKSKVLGFNLNGEGTKGHLIDLQFEMGEPTLTVDEFISALKKQAKLDKSTIDKIKTEIANKGYKGLLNKKF